MDDSRDCGSCDCRPEEGCCRDEYVIESHDLQAPDSYEISSQIFGAPIELVLRDLLRDVAILKDEVAALRDAS